MGRPLRAAVGGVIYRILNRANGRLPLFEKPGDYETFVKILAEAHERVPMRMLAYCMMPNHRHLVLWPRRDEELSRFMAWVTLTHPQRWHAHRRSAGAGHLYQGRFKSFPMQADEHFLTVSVCRAQCLAGKAGRACGGVVLVKSLAKGAKESEQVDRFPC